MTNSKEIYLGNTIASAQSTEVQGEEVKMGEEDFYKISHVDAMRPFFMTIVSESNHWMFISSNGGLTAGRKDASHALFPYYTDDKITEMAEVTGSKTILLVTKDDNTYLWEPFSIRNQGIYSTERNLYKNSFGNKVIFEEINHDLSLIFTYEWSNSDQFGFVRKSQLTNCGDQETTINFLDGIQNVLPWGVPDGLQLGTSNLVDAYKKTERRKDSEMAIFSLSAVIVDRAEPSEALRANVAWYYGLNNPKILLSPLQIDAFRRGNPVVDEYDVRAEKGAYLLNDQVNLGAGEKKEWVIVADLNKSITDIVELEEQISQESITDRVHTDIDLGTERLIKLVGEADGIQYTADNLKNTRHFSNTMFNLMRGGIFDHGYEMEKVDFVPYIRKSNKDLYVRKKSELEQLPDRFTLSFLQEFANKEEDKDLQRLCLEYLPLKFSRRHGDPSRPWNKFSINTKDETDGSKILDYQGNWRDIFQNWEALAHSYPEFIEGMIYKFLNATTFEGYNPYRVTKFGFDWETIEPDNPWAYIGYWGDHQIIYFQKFLEFMEDHYPGKLKDYFARDLFVYANVPYRIKSYEEMVKDPKNTIDFLFDDDKDIRNRRDQMGVDGGLLQDKNGGIYHVNFIEKILATALAKVSNFVPEAGIWLNTQRPEWNDANNALVGNGTSMVTLYYLRRFLRFFEHIFENQDLPNMEVSEEIYTFFQEVYTGLDTHKNVLSSSISDEDRRTITDVLGQAASDYRETIYEHGFSGKKVDIHVEELLGFTKTTLEFLEHSIRQNKREDNLYHAYNLITFTQGAIEVSYLPEMLEGQVAVLSSKYLNSSESLEVLHALKSSKLYREDQNSYILYPNRILPLFENRNTIPSSQVEKSTLLQALLDDNNLQVISQDLKGEYHFNGNFHNVNSLKDELGRLPEKYKKEVEKEADLVYSIFESVFNHKAFTGRSGTFYGYEGLGSIYWHMVSKLLLATYEIVETSVEEGSNEQIIDALGKHFHEINEGIGVHKTPVQYGAFPTDAYSHTPGGKGAQQPGMTGQVKEDVLCRFGELGVKVKDGVLLFDPVLLPKGEFHAQSGKFTYVTLKGEFDTIPLPENALAFTVCQVPVVYNQSGNPGIQVNYRSGEQTSLAGNALTQEITQSIMGRKGEIESIMVNKVQR